MAGLMFVLPNKFILGVLEVIKCVIEKVRAGYGL